MKIAVLTVLVLTLLGCGNPEAGLVGRWRADVQLTPAEKASSGADRITALAGGSLDLRDDHKFTRTFGNAITSTGTWSLTDGVVVLTALQLNGLPVEEARQRILKMAARRPNPALATKVANDLGKPERLRLSPDRKSMAHEDQRAGAGTITFVKIG